MTRDAQTGLPLQSDVEDELGSTATGAGILVVAALALVAAGLRDLLV